MKIIRVRCISSYAFISQNMGEFSIREGVEYFVKDDGYGYWIDGRRFSKRMFEILEEYEEDTMSKDLPKPQLKRGDKIILVEDIKTKYTIPMLHNNVEYTVFDTLPYKVKLTEDKARYYPDDIFKLSSNKPEPLCARCNDKRFTVWSKPGRGSKNVPCSNCCNIENKPVHPLKYGDKVMLKLEYAHRDGIGKGFGLTFGVVYTVHDTMKGCFKTKEDKSKWIVNEAVELVRLNNDRDTLKSSASHATDCFCDICLKEEKNVSSINDPVKDASKTDTFDVPRTGVFNAPDVLAFIKNTSIQKSNMTYQMIAEDTIPISPSTSFGDEASQEQSVDLSREIIRRTMMAKKLAATCIEFAKSINAKRLNATLVHRHAVDTIKVMKASLDPEYVYEKIVMLLEEEGIEVK